MESSVISARIRNHAGQVIRAIEQEAPKVLDAFEVHTSGTSGDRFLEFYRRERMRMGAPRSTAPRRDADDVPEVISSR